MSRIQDMFLDKRLVKLFAFGLLISSNWFWKKGQWQGRNMVYGLRAQSPKYDWDQGSEERAQGSEEWDQGSQGFWAQIRDQIYYTV